MTDSQIRRDVFQTPARRVAKPSGQAMPEAPDRVVVWTMTVLLVVSVMLQNVIIPLGGGLLFFDIVPLYLAIGVLVFFGRITLSAVRLMLYILSFAVAIFLQTTVAKDAAVTSMYLAMLIYFTYLGVIKTNRATHNRILRNFQYVVLAIAILVYMDIAVQLVHIDMPDINRVVPERFLVHTYNYVQPIIYGATLKKPNAFFMLEASMTSQFIAMGLAIELGLFHRWRMVLAFTVALIMTFATTGVLLTVLCLPFVIGRHWRKAVVAAVVVLPILAGGAYFSGWAEVEMARLKSLDKEDSSFTQRFVLPYTAMWDLAKNGSESQIIAGYGAGSSTRLLEIAEYNTISRSFIEYGFLFFVTFMAFFNLCFLYTGVPFIVVWASLMNYHFMSGNFHLACTVSYCFVLVTAYSIRKEPKPQITAEAANANAVTVGRKGSFAMTGAGGMWSA